MYPCHTLDWVVCLIDLLGYQQRLCLEAQCMLVLPSFVLAFVLAFVVLVLALRRVLFLRVVRSLVAYGLLRLQRFE